jgi:Phage Single-stranded DNA-binding protein
MQGQGLQSEVTVAAGGDQLAVPAKDKWDIGESKSGYVTSLDTSTLQGKLAVVAAIDGDADRAESWINRDILVSDVLIHPVRFEDDATGEVVDAFRTVLFMVDGRSFASVSSGVNKSIALLIKTFGPPTWKGGLPLLLERIATRRGRSRYRLTLRDVTKNAKT